MLASKYSSYSPGMLYNIFQVDQFMLSKGSFLLL